MENGPIQRLLTQELADDVIKAEISEITRELIPTIPLRNEDTKDFFRVVGRGLMEYCNQVEGLFSHLKSIKIFSENNVLNEDLSESQIAALNKVQEDLDILQLEHTATVQSAWGTLFANKYSEFAVTPELMKFCAQSLWKEYISLTTGKSTPLSEALIKNKKLDALIRQARADEGE